MPCLEENCKVKRPVFNLPGHKNAIYCKSHKNNNMINVIHKRCIYQNCNKIPVFNISGKKKGIYCDSHKTNDMINVNVTENRKCLKDNCHKIPWYNYENETKTIYCYKHKLDNMVNIRINKCTFNECYKIPSFNFNNEKKPIYCKTHAKENMINVTERRICKYEGCQSKQQSFNYINEKKGIYCCKHALEGMINITEKRICIDEDCKSKQPRYNFKGNSKGIYCIIHKKENMIDVIHPTCMYPDCITRPSHNYITEKKPLYCKVHSLKHMKNIISIQCIYENCETLATFNYKNIKKPLYCAEHKLQDMISVSNLSKNCIENACNIRASCNFPNLNAIYCQPHSKQGMENVVSKRCILCPTFASKKYYKGYCYRCFIYTFPDSPILRNHKTKERTVADYIKEEFSDYDFKFDKIIQDGCSRRRPDILLDMVEYVIIIEIDENQHQNYDCSCENKRLMEIFQDCGSRPLVMIRFNPDQYYNNAKSIPSCWTTTNDRGLCIVKPAKKKEWESRLEKLKETIQLQIDFSEERKNIDVIHLFYDQLL